MHINIMHVFHVTPLTCPYPILWIHLNKNNLCGHSFSQDFLFPFLKDIHNISLMLSVHTESLCFCISLGLYKEQQRHLHVPQRQGDRKIPKTNSVLAWRLSGSLSPGQPLPPPWIGVIVQCNHIMPHLNIHSQDKALEDKGGAGII